MVVVAAITSVMVVAEPTGERIGERGLASHGVPGEQGSMQAMLLQEEAEVPGDEGQAVVGRVRTAAVVAQVRSPAVQDEATRTQRTARSSVVSNHGTLLQRLMQVRFERAELQRVAEQTMQKHDGQHEHGWVRSSKCGRCVVVLVRSCHVRDAMRSGRHSVNPRASVRQWHGAITVRMCVRVIVVRVRRSSSIVAALLMHAAHRRVQRRREGRMQEGVIRRGAE